VKKKPHLANFLEDFFQSLKEYLDGGTKTGKSFINKTILLELERELLSILALCERLNINDEFIQKLNDSVELKRADKLLFKTEHFFLSDVIFIYEQLVAKQGESSEFILAFYYDVLRNNHFASEKDIPALNQLLVTDDFKSHLKNLRKKNNLSSRNEIRNNYSTLDALSENNLGELKEIAQHYERFIHLAFDLKFKSEKEKMAFLNVKTDVKESDNSHVSAIVQEDTLEDVLEELNQLIGLKSVKKEVNELINLLEIQKKRSNENLKNPEISLHSVFLGPPGTGKTSVARLLSRIYKHLGFLSEGQSYETDREGLIAGYVGQTAVKTDKAITESRGGVLFIDEAYALTENTSGNDFGSEAVNTLIKRMEDYRDDFVVVVAGYTEPMKQFIESNPGLRSRFSRFFYFDHFNPTELLEIFERFCTKSDFIVSEEAKEKLTDTFDLLSKKRDESFGNARLVRNLFEKCIQNHANRIIQLAVLNKEILKKFEEVDIPEPKETLSLVKGDYGEKK